MFKKLALLFTRINSNFQTEGHSKRKSYYLIETSLELTDKYQLQASVYKSVLTSFIWSLNFRQALWSSGFKSCRCVILLHKLSICIFQLDQLYNTERSTGYIDVHWHWLLHDPQNIILIFEVYVFRFHNHSENWW